MVAHCITLSYTISTIPFLLQSFCPAVFCYTNIIHFDHLDFWYVCVAFFLSVCFVILIARYVVCHWVMGIHWCSICSYRHSSKIRWMLTKARCSPNILRSSGVSRRTLCWSFSEGLPRYILSGLADLYTQLAAYFCMCVRAPVNFQETSVHCVQVLGSTSQVHCGYTVTWVVLAVLSSPCKCYECCLYTLQHCTCEISCFFTLPCTKMNSCIFFLNCISLITQGQP